MTVSLFSILLTCFESCVLILVLDLVLKRRKQFRLIHADAVFLLMVMIGLRLGFPVTLFYALPVQIPAVLNPVTNFMRQEFLPGFSVIQLLLGFWITGAGIRGFTHLRNHLYVEKTASRIRQCAKKTSVRELVGNSTMPDYPVYISASIQSPRIMGKDKSILLPDLHCSRHQTECILLHEIRHLENHDYLKKQLVEWILIVWWWLPPVYLLRRHISLYAEVMADGEAVWNRNEAGQLEYALSLVEVQKLLHPDSPKQSDNSAFSSFYISDDAEVLAWRIERLSERDFISGTSGFCLVSLAVLAFLSSFVALEPAFLPPAADYRYSQSDLLDSGLLISHKDGSWSFCIDGEYMEIRNPASEFLVGVPVIYE